MVYTIFDRTELAVADDVYIRNGNGTYIGVQTYNTYQQRCIRPCYQYT